VAVKSIGGRGREAGKACVQSFEIKGKEGNLGAGGSKRLLHRKCVLLGSVFVAWYSMVHYWGPGLVCVLSNMNSALVRGGKLVVCVIGFYLGNYGIVLYFMDFRCCGGLNVTPT